MSENLARVYKAHNPREEEEAPLHPDEKRALARMQAEAKKNGATLASEGKGGLPPSLALGVFRRDGWVCKKCGGRENLSLHHKGHLENPGFKWLKNKGKSNDPNNIVTICEGCHDAIHEEDRDDD